MTADLVNKTSISFFTHLHLQFLNGSIQDVRIDNFNDLIKK